MGAASAADVSSEPAANYTGDVPLGASEDTGGADVIGAPSEGNNVLGEGSTGSFAELEQYINDNKEYEKVIYLDKDYAFDNATDSDYNITGIYIGTFVTIDGQGHTIDAKNTQYIFNTIGKQVTLKNILFKNTNYRAIEVGSSDVSIINCTFDNNTGRAVGLSTSAVNCVIDDCTFTNGAGIYSSATGAVISNSLFKNNTATNGGAIQVVNVKNNVIENCEFINNTATNGGAIYFKYDFTYGNLIIKNSNFLNNSARWGGAIHTQNAVIWEREYVSKHNTVKISSSNFKDNIAVQDPEIGGSVVNDDSPYQLSDNTFDGGKYYDELDILFDNLSGNVINLTKDYTLTQGYIQRYIVNKGTFTINGNGHTIDANGNSVFNFILTDGAKLNINNLTIINANGTAMYIQYYHQNKASVANSATVNIDYCVFLNNTGSSGGAIKATADRVQGSYPMLYIRDSVFDNNTAINNGGAVYCNTPVNFNAQRSNFTNSVAYSGGALYHEAAGRLQFGNCIFENNSAYSYGDFCAGSAGLSSNPNIKNNYFINSTAYVEPIGATFDNGTNGNYYINNTRLSYDLASYFENITNNTVNIDKYDYISNGLIKVPTNVVVDGNGSTIYGNGTVFQLMGNNTIENLIIIGGSISVSDYFTSTSKINNITFINCTNTNTIGLSSVGDLSNLTFINCTRPFSSTQQALINWTNITIDGITYNDDLGSYLHELCVYHANSADTISNITITLPKNNYNTLSTVPIFSSNIIIDGNGSTITSLYGLDCFRIFGKNVTFKNFIFENVPKNAISFDANPNIGYDYTSECYVDNITFINVTNPIYSIYGGEVNNCNFINGSGSAIRSPYSYGIESFNVSNSNFENCKIIGDGLVTSCYLSIENCNFTNITTLGGKGGAIYNRNSANIANSNFINCSALSGGAIYQNRPNGVVNVSKSTFDGNVAKAAAGAIYVEGTLILDDCDFVNNTADNCAGFIAANGLILTNSNFTHNDATLGGAGSVDGDNTLIEYCIFDNNTAMVGGGLNLQGVNNTVQHCSFVNNTATAVSSAMQITGDNAVLFDNTIWGSSAPNGAAILIDGNNANITGCTIVDNSATDQNGTMLVVNGNGTNLDKVNVSGNNGNAIALNGDDAVITDSIISDNNGTAIFVNGNNAKVSESNITNNKADAIIINGDNTVLTGNNVLDNEGYGVIFNGTNTVIENTAVLRNLPHNVYVDENSNYDPSTHKDEGNDFGDDEDIITWKDSLLTVIVENNYEGNPAIVNITLTDLTGNPFDAIVYVKINNTNVPIMVINGTGIAEVPGLTSGSYNVLANYTGNIVNHYAVTNTTSFTVTPKNNISVNVSDVEIFVGENATVNVNVTDVINGQNITITVNGKKEEVTVKDGKASANFTDLKVGEYEILVEYAGEGIYAANTTNATLTVNKINTDLTSIKL